MSEIKFNTIDEYISMQPEEVRPLLQKVRQVIKEAAPDSIEKISWSMPTFWQGENLVHFAAFKNHIGFYPGDRAIVFFEKRLERISHSKGAIRFPYDREADFALISDITKWRLKTAGEKKGK